MKAQTSPERVAATEQSRLGIRNPALCPEQASEFRNNYNVHPFGFTHGLADHPLFDLPQLMRLSEFLQGLETGTRLVLFNDDARLDQGWARRARPGAVVQDGLEHINDSHSWILMKDIQRHPDYRALLDQLMDELGTLAGENIRQEVSWIDAYVTHSAFSGVGPRAMCRPPGASSWNSETVLPV